MTFRPVISIARKWNLRSHSYSLNSKSSSSLTFPSNTRRLNGFSSGLQITPTSALPPVQQTVRCRYLSTTPSPNSSTTGGNVSMVDDEAVPCDTMVHASEFVYRFTTLRNIILTHDAQYGKGDKPKVPFHRPELIITQSGEKNIKTRPHAHLKYPVTCAAILEFVQKNRHYLEEKDSGKIKFNNDWKENDTNKEDMPKLEAEKVLEEMVQNFDADVWEFDDTMSKKDLVYAIIVNRSDKRITIVFRGSVTLKDWLIDLSLFSTQPEELNKFARERGDILKDGEDINIHSGFAKYLFDKRDGVDQSKFDEILDDLQDIFNYKNEENGIDYSDYSLFVTGHSLGGALAQLLSFTLATKQQKDVKSYTTPITSITYASPRVGKSTYAKAFQELEKRNLLRHIRVSNDKDVIPVAPPFYEQTGVNIHLYKDADPKPDATYDKSTWLISQLRPWSAGAHFMAEYNDRVFANLEQSGDDILGKSVKQLYKEYAGINLP